MVKIQDILFGIAFIALVVSGKRRTIVYIGLFCLICAMPLFAKWIFFTAERLTWYASALFLMGIILKMKRKNSSVV